VQDFTKLIAAAPSLSVDTSQADYPFIRIHHEKASATVALHGAHVTEWTPNGERPVIYTSPTAIYREGKAIRGGVPICWPWFNAHPSDSKLPSHGVARNTFWTLSNASEDENGVTLSFALPRTDTLITHFSPEFDLKFTIKIGKELTMTLLTENTSQESFQVGGALHTYFSISDISAITLTGLENTTYIDTVGQETLRKQTGPITFSGETDRIYIETCEAVTIKDPNWNRSILVKKSGSSSTVVWNPAAEKSTALADLPNDGYTDFVCIEAANARRDVTLLESGQLTTLEQRISVSHPS